MTANGAIPWWWLSRGDSSSSPSPTPTPTPPKKNWTRHTFGKNVPHWWKLRAPSLFET